MQDTARYLLLVLLIAGIGCGKTDARRPRMTITDETPESRLDWVMERLNRVAHRSSQSEGGLRIRQTITHQLFPPTESVAHYTAQITIESTTFFLPVRPKSPEATEKPGIFGSKQKILKRNPLVFDPAAPPRNEPLVDPMAEFRDLAGTINDKPLTVDARVPPRKQSEKKVYPLAYRDDYWQLTEQPESEYEQLLFEYALEK